MQMIMGEQEIFLSLIIPCYNVAEYLGKTIASLEALADAEDVEFLFVDDGSKDETLQLIKEFEARDRRVKCVSQPNQGVSAARNNALPLVQGRYFSLLDGDDFLNADAVQVIRAKIGDADLLIPDIHIYRPTRTYVWRNHIPCGTYDVDALFEVCKFFPTSPKLIYRTSIMKEHSVTFNSQIKCAEVFDFTVSFLKYANSVVVVDDAFYNYVIREASATHLPHFDADKTSMLLLNYIAVQNKSEWPWMQSAAFDVTVFRLIMAFTYLKYVHQKQTSPEAQAVVKELLSDKTFKKLVRRVAYGPNRLLKERLIAIYLHLMPNRLGFMLMAH